MRLPPGHTAYTWSGGSNKGGGNDASPPGHTDFSWRGPPISANLTTKADEASPAATTPTEASPASPPHLTTALADLRNAQTVVRGSALLHKLCFQRPGYKRAAVAAGALPLLASALEADTKGVTQPGAAKRSCACCKALRTIAFRSPALKDAAGDAGCVEAATAVLRACGLEVAEEALWALSSLCANHDANIARAQAAGALVAVMQCQRAHRKSAAVKAKAMMLVALLS